LRKLAAALLAVPVLAGIYLPVLTRRTTATRIGLAVGVSGLVAIGAFGLMSPPGITATKPLPAIVPLEQAAFTASIAANQELDAPVQLAFSGPMDQASVAASLDVAPPTPVRLSWDATGSRVTVNPASHWQPGAYYTITVRAGALAASGRPIAKPARAVFVTRNATTASIAVTGMAGKAAAVTSGFAFTFDRPVAIGAVRKALEITPEIRGSLDLVASAPGTTRFVFTPSEVLATQTAYSVALGPLLDASGAPVAESAAMKIETTAAPAVVRFRPKADTTNVPRDAMLSVRFTEPMEHRSTKSAFLVTTNGKPVAGTVTFVEKSTVLVFRPTGLLPYGAILQLRVNDTARSAAGARLEESRTIWVRVLPAPKAAAPARAKPAATRSIPRGASGGGAVGGGSWGAVETYYLRLMNCTRTGGWVTSSGSCSSPGGRNVAALRLDSGISSRVSRPYAKRLATSGQCSHFIGGNPGDRLRAAGYTSYIWAENLGCRSGNPYSAVLGSHLFFQSERSYNGGHYVNLMNAKYDRVGIGVWVSGGRVRLVIDFYHPR
jgi:Big-like domain-containing protein